VLGAGVARTLLIVTGESNAAGYALNSSGPTAGELAARSSVQILNNTSLLREDLDVGTNANIGQLLDNTTHGIEIGFANTVEAGRYALTSAELVKTGASGSLISQWASGSAYWTTAVERVEAHIALLDAAGIAYKPEVLISIGINDASAGTSNATFKAGLIDLIARWRTLLGASTRVLLTKFQGPNMTPRAGINTVIDEIVAADANTYAVDTTDLTVRDTAHWDAQGFRVLAERVADILNGASGTLATPSMSPAGGTYTSLSPVTISGPSGATIRYTIDGTEPTSRSTVYSTAITPSPGQTIKARAFRKGWKNSAVASETYSTTSTWVTWTSMQNASQAGDFMVTSGSNPSGGIASTTINGAADFAVIWDIPNLDDVASAIVYLSDTNDAYYVFDGGLTMRVGAFPYSGKWYYSTGFNFTEFGNTSAPRLFRMRKSGSNAVFDVSDDNGGSWSNLGSVSGVLAGAGTLYLKALFGAPVAGRGIRVRIEQ
jgi:hypothetical protein